MCVWVGGGVTFFDGFDAATTGDLVCGEDACEDCEEGDCDPPAYGVADEVDLLTDFVAFGPEGDTSEEEGPGNGLRGIWMR